MIEYINAYKNKITNKLFGVVSLKTKKKKVGVVLMSFITGPFTLTPKERFTDPHTNYWVCPEIARLFLERGYDVDVINWNNKTFLPRKKYSVCIDLQHNLERLSAHLPEDCIKVMFIISSYPQFQNNAEQKRIDYLHERKGVLVPFKRKEEDSKNIFYTDFIGGYGNQTVHDSYPESIRHKIQPISVPSMDTYELDLDRNLDLLKKNFVWFGGGGAILKGLDIIVEVFAKLPNLNLHLVGPAAYEEEFVQIYKKELNLPNIKRYPRPKINKDGVAVTKNEPLEDIIQKSAFVVGMSASEGGGAATVQAMQMGLVRITTPQTGIRDDAPGFVVYNPTIEALREIIISTSKIDTSELKNMSKQTWDFCRKNHTKEKFSISFSKFIDKVLSKK